MYSRAKLAMHVLRSRRGVPYRFDDRQSGSAKPEADLDYYLNGAGGEGVNPGDAERGSFFVPAHATDEC